MSAAKKRRSLDIRRMTLEEGLKWMLGYSVVGPETLWLEAAMSGDRAVWNIIASGSPETVASGKTAREALIAARKKLGRYNEKRFPRSKRAA